MCYPTNAPRVFHVEIKWKPPFSRRFNVEYICCVCKTLYVSPFLSNIPIIIPLENTIEPSGIKRKLRKV